MIRVLTAWAIILCAIGLTGLIITSIGKFLLTLGELGATYVALGFAIAVIVVCTLVTNLGARRRAN